MSVLAGLTVLAVLESTLRLRLALRLLVLQKT